MYKLFICELMMLVFFGNAAFAQDTTDKAFQTAVLQKLDQLENRLNDMDKRYEVRFTTLEVKLEAVNQRIDDKFNLIVGLLGIVAAFLALPYAPKLLDRFKAQPQNQEDIQRLEKQIEQIKAQISQLQTMRSAL